MTFNIGAVHCETCAYWEQGWSSPFNNRSADPRWQEWGYCSAQHGDDRGLAYTNEPNDVPLIVHRTFGCVQWKKPRS